MVDERSGARPGASAGFSLVEVLIAAGLLAGGLLALSQLALASSRLQQATHDTGLALELARRKVEQIRSLAWTAEGPHPVSDVSTNLATEPPSAGGVGLAVSPADALTSNVSGYCDLADASGRWIGECDRGVRGAAWVRRWSFGSDPRLPGALLVDVVVLPARVVTGRLGAGGPPRVHLSTVRARRVP